KGIFQGESQTVLFRPLSGILRQRKYIPLRYMHITIELSLVDNAADPLVRLQGTIFTQGNNSHLWSILNAQVKCDLVTLDSGLNESYVNVLEEG
ncbi:MAG: hypothetical protein ACKPKO_35025, partial [Candidatus Fonsibacter sp.]